MRLLDTTWMVFKEFSENQIPFGRYAVLSHRWTDEEPTFKSFRKGHIDLTEGYNKVIRCCDFAKSRNIPWVWLDTVCIDKRSSAELSESLNSMFRWYQQSAECYVHLADVTLDGHDREEVNRLLRKSQWFTRGWTLQELLAPSKMIFCDADWNIIGRRDDDELVNEISIVTGIGTYDINNFSVHRSSVARKMSWASARETTRPEDMAYCLLGLFDVHMPLLYGEGATKAFLRLQLEIMRKSNDKSIFAWALEPEMNMTWNGMLASSPKCFRFSAGVILDEASVKNRYPYEMTNQGLRFQSDADLISGGRAQRYIVDLECFNRTSNRCAIILERVGEGTQDFRRRHTGEFARDGGMELGVHLADKYPQHRRERVEGIVMYVKQAGL